jgi:hypothetical protein
MYTNGAYHPEDVFNNWVQQYSMEAGVLAAALGSLAPTYAAANAVIATNDAMDDLKKQLAGTSLDIGTSGYKPGQLGHGGSAWVIQRSSGATLVHSVAMSAHTLTVLPMVLLHLA